MLEFKYYRILKRNRELFNGAFEIAAKIKSRAEGVFKDCKVYIVGSFARNSYTLSSDLDILIVSDEVPEKFEFEWYSKIVKMLTDDERVNIHLWNRGKFKNVEKLYCPRIPV
ncbi:nucleotidyltransferase domain-containing protein [Archaeoglobales archaeon]|nr:MAG: nucleotidyltransferase domain-containing protein [Archaeoglobales archaeon]